VEGGKVFYNIVQKNELLKDFRYPKCFVQNYSYGLSLENLENDFAKMCVRVTK
jgi:hypothetical protein